MITMGRCGAALVVVLATSSFAAADDAPMDRLWPTVPESHALSLEDRLTDRLTELGNTLGQHLDLLSHDMVGLHVDGRAQRARLRLGGGNPHYLTFRIDSNWHFTNGQAQVTAHLELGLAGHVLDLMLPEMDLSSDSVNGQRIVQVNVPLLERRF